MREIKFRVREKVQKIMLTDGFALSPNGQVSFYWNKEPIHSAHAILMQFTGLKDKNGKEIYEGDIFKYEQWHGSIEHTMAEQQAEKEGNKIDWHTTGVIIWHPEAACYIHRKPNDIEDMTYHGNTFSASWAKEWEVIGNIYEHSNLLSP